MIEQIRLIYIWTLYVKNFKDNGIWISYEANGDKEGCSKYGNKPIYYSMGRAASPQSATAAESRFKFSLMTLSSWDYSVTSPEASFNLSKGIVSMFKVRTLYLFPEGQYYDLFKVVV